MAAKRSTRAGSRKTTVPRSSASRKSTARKTASSAKKARTKASAKKKAAAKQPTAKKAAPKKAGKKKVAPSDATVERVRALLDVMASAGAVELELDDNHGRLRLRLPGDPAVGGAAQMVAYAPPPSAPAAAPAAELAGSSSAATPASPAAAGGAAADGEVFRSPMVGTLYRAPSPDAEPYAKIGDRVHADTTLCIIEAMKVMNEIKAETEGEIVDILVQNEEPVDYDQPLFVIR